MGNKIILLLFALLLSACAAQELPPVFIDLPTRNIDYLTEVKPLLDKRCVVCHSCYNSPCQLKLSSYEGVDRGATKKQIYNATRLTTMDPTRLFTDAQSTQEWRQKGFFTVTESNATNGNNSIMLQLLSHKMKKPKSIGDYFPEAADLTCPETMIELGGYLEKHPNRGMPLGFPPLKDAEFKIIAGWLGQGAKGPSAEEQKIIETPSLEDSAKIKQWERFFNQQDAKHVMTSRYLYEHLFLAHIDFGTDSNDFFELVRSTTGPGEDVDLINTVRPYDAPGVNKFYYRFRKIHSTIVHKTHMVLTLDYAQLDRFNELFIQPEWILPPHIEDYEARKSANPFMVFEQIPPRSRYKFLLDNAQYTLMTFIRGPVCKGQVALNVIRDHFWILFVDPDHDLTVQYPAFLKFHTANLRLPTEKGSEFKLANIVWNRYADAATNFYRARQDYYTTHNYYGIDYDAIWRGDNADSAPLLTVYRHFDSASVIKGAIGNLPRTMWLVDYPLFERIYYSLVAGFDVFGTLGHQVEVRKYMDLLRVEAESNFLDFFPLAKRRAMMQSWNRGVKLRKLHYYPSKMPGGIKFKSNDIYREFVENVISDHLLPATGITFDKINYLFAGEEYGGLPDKYETIDDYIQGLRAVSKPGTPFFTHFNDYNANLAYIRIRVDDGDDVVLSIIVNRWHENVAEMFGEAKRFVPAKDKAEFIKGFIGSYPNYFIDVKKEELPDLLYLLANFHATPEDIARFRSFGINRADDDFWEQYDWFQKRFNEDDPLRSGLFDLNRYYFKAK